MVESPLSGVFASEAALTEAARSVAERWRALGLKPLVVGLAGDLGSGKTTWARAMLRGLGHTGRVPSPTYTLVERYDTPGIVVAHFDCYRLAYGEELENLGIRDWLAETDTWLLVEWPERARALSAACDLTLRFEIDGGGRRVTAEAHTARGLAALAAVDEIHRRRADS